MHLIGQLQASPNYEMIHHSVHQSGDGREEAGCYTPFSLLNASY
ncbi:hypothetical protein WG66_009589, partial [Moniliophthora roreri]